MRLNGLLRQLEEIWREAGDDATLAALQPGLTPAAFLTQGEEVGLTLPIELQTWFEWHDGGVPHPGYGPRIGASHLEFISLRGAVELYRFQCDFTRDLAAEYAQGGIAPTMAELGWDPSWFPIFVGGSEFHWNGAWFEAGKAGAWDSNTWMMAALVILLAGVAGAISMSLAELSNRLFYARGNSHIDPPAMAIWISTILILGSASLFSGPMLVG